MAYNGTTVLFSFLSKAGETFWLALPLLVGVVFTLVYPAIYALSLRGRLLKRKRKLASFYEKDRKGDSLKYLKKELEVEEILKKDLPREIGWTTEIVLALTYFLTCFGITAISSAVLILSSASWEKVSFVAFCSFSSTAFCGIAVLSFLVTSRDKTLRAIDYIKKMRYMKYHLS